MRRLNEIFHIRVSSDKLNAVISFTDVNKGDLGNTEITENAMMQFLKENKIVFGIKENVIKTIISKFPHVDLPVTIAEGLDKVDGEDGKITYVFDMSTEVDRSKGWNFREVMRIPTVQKDEKLATIVPPTNGKNGKSVYGMEIKARPGKPILMRAGKNVTFNKSDQSFYATAEGQVNVARSIINVHTVYEVNEDVSMKTGNIDFAGTVVIRGDVPTGFTVKATGDIKIYGLVEAATIIAEGNVFVSEGIAGLKTGIIEANENVHIGYVNQANITSGNSIYVENSILHSECSATNDIICQRGNIIGGTLSVGRSIEAKDVGNRMNTSTELSFGMDKKLFEEQVSLEAEKERLQDNLKKLNFLKNKIEADHVKLDSKARVTLLKLTHSLHKTREELSKIEGDLLSLNASLGNIEHAYLKVGGTLYPNVVVSFGKYKRTIDKEYHHVTVTTDKNEIRIT